MTSYKFGDVVLVPFPFTDQTSIKKRPAVVISSSFYHEKRPDVMLMGITSQVKEDLIEIEHFVCKWKEAGLLKPSIIKPVVTTLEKNLILKKMGALVQEDQMMLIKILQKIFSNL